MPSNQQPPQIDVPTGTSQVGGQINIQPASGALPPINPNSPQANQQPPNSDLNAQGQIPSSLFNQQGPSQLNPVQPPRPPLPPFDPNLTQQTGGATFGNQPNPQTPPMSSDEHGQQQFSSSENGQPAFNNQGGPSTQDLFDTQPPNSDASLSSPVPPSTQGELERNNHEQLSQNQAAEGFTGQPANSSVNAIVSGLVLLFAALIAML